LLAPCLLVSGDQGIGGHGHQELGAQDPNHYHHYPPAQYSQPTAYGNAAYDPASATAYGYSYDYPLDQANEVDEAADKQAITAPLAFLPFFASFTLPLGAAISTFMTIIGVSAMFLLFPQTVEVEVNGMADMTGGDGDGDDDADGDDDNDNDDGEDNEESSENNNQSGGDGGKWRNKKKKKTKRTRRALPSRASGLGGFCKSSNSTLCRILDTLLISTECLEAASCEVASLTKSAQFPVMAHIVKPFVSDRYYPRFADVDCSSLKCKYRYSY